MTPTSAASPSSAPRLAVPVVYGLVHALVDAATVTAVMQAALAHGVAADQAFAVVVGYDAIAFGAQALVGLVTDALRAGRATAMLGVLLTALSLLVPRGDAWVAMAVAGAGNAMFHVGAGALSLSVDPGRASAPGIFVGPGAVGLALGMYLGKMADTPRWPFFVLLVLGLLVLPLVSVAPAPAREEPRTAAVGQAEGVAIVLLLLFSVLVRSFVGMAGFHAVHKTVAVGFAIATAAFAGKAVGGFVADRVGWIRSSVGALLVSAPVIAFGAAHTYAMVAAMFVFQMTMPVTLVALTVVMPRRPAFSFGVACVALVAGAIPTFFPPVHRFYSDVGFFALILTSALSLAVALHRVGRRAPSGHPVDSAPEADRALAS